MRSPLVLVIAVVTVVLGPRVPVGHAQPTGGDARELAEMARRSYNLGRWQDAIEGFERSYQLTGDPALLFNLAQAHRQLDHVPEALRLYRAYLRERPNGPDRTVAQEQITELERRRPPPAALATPSPIPAKSAPVTPPVVTPAPAPAVATKPLAPPPAVPPPATAPAAAAVTTPSPTVAPAPVSVTAAPAPAPTATAMATASPETIAPGPPAPPMPRWLPWLGAGVTVALASAAVVVGLSSNQRFDELASTCGRTADGCTDGDIDAVKARTRTANILWGAAAAMALATGVGVYVNTREAGVSGLVRF